VNEDIDRTDILANGVGKALNAVIAVLLITFIVERFLIDVSHRVVTDIAGDYLFDLQFACAKRELPRLFIQVALEDIGDDVGQARMRRENQARAGGRQCFADLPGEAAVISDAGDHSQFAFEIEWNHASL